MAHEIAILNAEESLKDISETIAALEERMVYDPYVRVTQNKKLLLLRQDARKIRATIKGLKEL